MAEATLRFSHPFFTSKPPAARTAHGGFHRASEFARATLGPIPKPLRDPTFSLADVIGKDGVKEVEAAGMFRFQATGDTGRTSGSDEQEQVAEDMASDFHPDAPGQSPAFFLHLGDVIYGHRKDELYRDEFYRPYKNYPGKILAIPGNHDGESWKTTDPVPLSAFQANFCPTNQDVPAEASAVGIFRQPVRQPGVYWRLEAPFADVIGLYSNVAEGPGFLDGGQPPDAAYDAPDAQKKWLETTLKTVAQERKSGRRKALVFAVHHPPYSSSGHQGSAQMLQDMDAICGRAGVMPDAVLAGHSHTYQRYTRRMAFDGRSMEIPYIVAGCGGHAANPVKEARGQQVGDVTYNAARQGYGYLMVTAGLTKLQIELWSVPTDHHEPFDRVKIDLKTNALI